MLSFLRKLDPTLFEQVVIEPEPFVSKCVKPDMAKATNREERMRIFKELPRLHREFNECKDREEIE